MPDLLLIADDLTGAADSGVTFAQAGAEVLVGWEARSLPEADVVAISTESRHCPADEAAQRVKAAMAPLEDLLHRTDPPFIYKKIDSTLRGHPGLELATLMAGVGGAADLDGDSFDGGARCALVAPAFPAQGRITREGTQLVHGVPLAETVFGKEVATSQVREFFLGAFGRDRVGALSLADVRGGPAALRAHLRSMMAPGTSGPCVLVADAITEDDLGALADAALRCGVRLFCGSAGLAAALAARLAEVRGWSTCRRALCGCRLDQVGTPGKAASRNAGSAILVVAASRHPRTRRQVETLRVAGARVLSPDAFLREAGGPGAVEEPPDEALRSGAVVFTTVGLPELPGLGETLALRLAGRAAAWWRGSGASGLVLTGGDAAVAVSRALGAQALRLCGEVAPGLPWGRLVGGPADGLPVVTKAGGFGEDDALVRAVAFLMAE